MIDDMMIYICTKTVLVHPFPVSSVYWDIHYVLLLHWTARLHVPPRYRRYNLRLRTRTLLDYSALRCDVFTWPNERVATNSEPKRQSVEAEKVSLVGGQVADIAVRASAS